MPPAYPIRAPLRNWPVAGPIRDHRHCTHVPGVRVHNAAVKQRLRPGSHPCAADHPCQRHGFDDQARATRSGDAPTGKCGRSRRAHTHRRVRPMDRPLPVHAFCVCALRAVRLPGRVAAIRLRACRRPLGAQHGHARCEPTTSSGSYKGQCAEVKGMKATISYPSRRDRSNVRKRRVG
jgi:hypothetical protein